jgi:glycosyltransferase involved in cell wall biosynthesis
LIREMPEAGSSAIDISLVICTRNRSDRLQSCLAAVSTIRCHRRWEVAIVDNGSTDETAAVIERFIQTNALPARYVFEPRKGLSYARNAGVAATTGEVIAFTDDDCYPESDLLDGICEIFSDAKIGFIGGRILLHDPSDDPLTTNESREVRRFVGGSIVPCAVVQGANMAFRRAALLEVGCFDPSLGAGTPFPAEDWDAVARTCIRGWDGGYFPGPTVAHHHGRKASEAREQLGVYHYASGAVYAKLLLNQHTRWPYCRHWARRILGDAKCHQRKLLQEFRGAIDYWKSLRTR